MEYPDTLKELNTLYKALNDFYHSYAQSCGVSDSVSLIYYGLYILGDGCLQRDICNLGFVRKQTVNSAVQKLAAQGFLELRAGRGRDMHLFLTEKGQCEMQRVAGASALIEQRAFESLGKEGGQQLLRLTRDYICALRENAQDAASPTPNQIKRSIP